ncbi:hypothetical protein HID58_047762, partial [Brassica napus]
MLRLQGSSHVFLLLSISFLTSFRLVDCGRCLCFVIRDRDGCFGLILLHAFALLAEEFRLWMILFRPVVYSPLYQYILACLAVSNFNVLVSSRMNLELPVFDGFRCHYRLLRVQVKLISELVNGCLKEKLSVEACSGIGLFSTATISLCPLSLFVCSQIFSSSTTSPMFLVVHLFKLKDNHQMEFCYGVSVSGKLSRLLKGRFSGLLSLSSSDEEGSRWNLDGARGRSYFDLSVELIMDKLQVPSSSKVLRMQYNVFQFFAPGSQVVWCFVGFEGSKLWVHHWFHNRVSGYSNTVAFASVYVDCSVRCLPRRWCLFLSLSRFAVISRRHMNLAFVRIWSETCPSDCEGTSQSFAHQTRDCSSNGEVWGYGFMMTCSKISKHVFSSNMQGFGNLRSLNLTSCKRPTQFPDLLKATNLEAVKPSSCVNWE